MDTPTEISESDHLMGTRDIEQERQSTITAMASQLEVIDHGEESLELLGEVYHLAIGGSASTGFLDDYSPILESFRSPMKNTVLHLAAMHGNDAMVDRVATQYPKLLFSCNVNGDTPLHVAARAGHVSMLIKLLVACAASNATRLLGLMEMENNQGNIMLHEAIVSGHRSMVTNIFNAVEELSTRVKSLKTNYLGEPVELDFLVEEACCMEKNANMEDRLGSWPQSCYELAWNKVNKKKQSVLCLAVEARLTETVNQILRNCPANATPMGRSPLEAAIEKRDTVMLNSIVSEKREWIHLSGEKRRLPLHYAAFIGYHEGVVYLLDKCKNCSNERDAYGSLPLHQAARGGHVNVVKELLQYCPDPNEMVDSNLCNILHIAVERGKLDMVRYILRTPALEKMINRRDKFGRTPLHAAILWNRPTIVFALTWDDRVDLNAVDGKNQTALDVAYGEDGVPSSIAEFLMSIALRSAGANINKTRRSDFESPSPLEAKPTEITENWEQIEKAFSSRVDSLSLISTLIVTASVAACLSVPGEAEGTAHNLHKAMFHFFIICITISFFSSVSATIILLRAKLESTREMYNSTFNLAMPLIEAALITLSLAFLAGVYTVISKLTWLATTFLVITAIFVLILCVLLITFYLPIFSTNKILRYISYYPFIFAIWMIKIKEWKP